MFCDVLQINQTDNYSIFNIQYSMPLMSFTCRAAAIEMIRNYPIGNEKLSIFFAFVSLRVLM